MPSKYESEGDRLNRGILQGNIERDPVGSKLTPEAKQQAVDFAMSVFKGIMSDGEASEIGIRHVTSKILK